MPATTPVLRFPNQTPTRPTDPLEPMSFGEGLLIALLALFGASALGFLVWARFRREVLELLRRILADVRALVDRDEHGR